MKKKKNESFRLSFEKVTVLELNKLKQVSGGQLPPDRTITESVIAGGNGGAYSEHCTG